MEHTITGRFQTKGKADAAAAALIRYVDRRDLCIFHHDPPGQHVKPLIGGNDDGNPGSDMAEKSEGTRARTAGPTAGAIGLAGGPMTWPAAAGVTAHAGSLIGTPSGSGNNPQSNPLPHLCPEGVILAVRIARPISRQLVVCDLRIFGADDIRQAEGEWLDGDWGEFNPAQEPRRATAWNEPTPRRESARYR